jgi:hypothetical protein
MRSSLFDVVTVTEFKAIEAYSSLILIKAKYSISRLSALGNGNVIVWMDPSNSTEYEKKNQHNDENVVYNQIYSQHKRISKSVLTVRNAVFPDVRNYPNFI